MQEIKQMIEKCLNNNFNNIIIYPFGVTGKEVKNILNVAYGKKETYIVDNELCKHNPEIYGMELFKRINTSDYAVLLSTVNPPVNKQLLEEIRQYFPKENIFSILSVDDAWYDKPMHHTEIGKYSSGPICHDHQFIKSIGSFCSFAEGVCVHGNHPTNYITTHPMLYKGSPNDEIEKDIPYEVYKGASWFFDGVNPIGAVKGNKRITIGNDVWLGRNVVVINSDIGNGVIAGAGAVIIHDVPDYAIVVGVPAKVIKYRFEKNQIEALNKIKWWDWPDEIIRQRHSDFYLPIDDFIKKYL